MFLSGSQLPLQKPVWGTGAVKDWLLLDVFYIEGGYTERYCCRIQTPLRAVMWNSEQDPHVISRLINKAASSLLPLLQGAGLRIFTSGEIREAGLTKQGKQRFRCETIENLKKTNTKKVMDATTNQVWPLDWLIDQEVLLGRRESDDPTKAVWRCTSHWGTEEQCQWAICHHS